MGLEFRSECWSVEVASCKSCLPVSCCIGNVDTSLYAGYLKLCHPGHMIVALVYCFVRLQEPEASRSKLSCFT